MTSTLVCQHASLSHLYAVCECAHVNFTCTCKYTCSCIQHLCVGALNGFAHIGDINSHLAGYEKQLVDQERREPLATSMLVIMVRGLFTHLKFPYAQFPCTELSGRYKWFV